MFAFLTTAAAAFSRYPYTPPDLATLISSLQSAVSPDAGYPQCSLGASSAASGVCLQNLTLPFCGKYITYSSVCVPARPGWSAGAKDAELAAQVQSVVRSRVAAETAATEGDTFTVIRFAQNPDCVSAYSAGVCWANFPQCGAALVCPAACENYFAACRFPDASGCHPSWPFPPSRAAPAANQTCTGTGSCSKLSLVFLFLIYLVA